MNKLKIFFGTACLLVAVGSAFASRSIVAAPDYVIDNPATTTIETTGCYLVAAPLCTGGPQDCYYIYNNTDNLPQYRAYEFKIDGVCVTPLTKP